MDRSDARRSIVLLGSTGSIGTQTLDVVASCDRPWRLTGLSAHTSWDALAEQARTLKPKWVTLTDEGTEADAADLPEGTELLRGPAGVRRMVEDSGTDVVLAAMVGAAGLDGTLAAVRAGKTVALANKESLVVGGPVVTAEARRCGGRLLPVDSEHSAIFQCLRAGGDKEVARIVLTASGGPFRTLPLDEFAAVTPERALDHPTWDMGPKVSIDSATMLNKAFELIEAHWLFGVPADRLAVVVHPQSMVHSMVEFVDGSVIAQVSPPDMRLPIQYALSHPERVPGPARRLDLADMGEWTFRTPDPRRYPALELGFEVIRRGGSSGAALNAAGEVAVDRFVAGELPFTDIARVCRDVLERHPFEAEPDVDALWAVDRWARQETLAWTPRFASCR